ncbi:hypothetical protein AB0P21_19435 [Kribbella sp. NPDC056861]|uniref:hypothetical protein n=1 Tax=Kribbella sp. NPDC056861 TaxID=3154857 RepID=UPI00343B61D4
MPTLRPVRLAVALVLVIATGVGVVTLTRGATAAPKPVTAEDQALLHRAEQRLIKQCMTTAGFQYDERPVPPERTERRFAYLIDDVAWAKVHGYDDPNPAPRSTNPNAQQAQRLPAMEARRWERTLIGDGKQISFELGDGSRISTSDKGCLATARRTLYGDLAGWFRARRTSDGLAYIVYAKVNNDQRYAAAMKEWVACVRGRGYPADSPGRLMEVVKQRTKGQPRQAIRAAEIAGAVTEAECATTTSVARTARELHAEHLTWTTAENRREFQELERLERAALPRARAALGPS